MKDHTKVVFESDILHATFAGQYNFHNQTHLRTKERRGIADIKRMSLKYLTLGTLSYDTIDTNRDDVERKKITPSK